MTHARARFALLVALVATAWMVTVPASAEAFVSYYNCVNKPGWQLCDGRANGSFDGLHSWDFNQAYSGAGITVCQAVINHSTSAWLAGDSCAPTLTSHYYGNVTCACYEANIYHGAGGNYSLDGFADAAY